MSGQFRFGVGVNHLQSRAALLENARRFEDLGFDVFIVPDHLGAIAPFPALAAVAAVTSTIRLGTNVLNCGFYRPALLARDAADVATLSEGRLELGLGAGYVRQEFEAAELPYPTAGQRVRHLEHCVAYLREHHPDIPLLVAGNGDRVLTLAAQHAQIVGLTGSDLGKGVADPLAERVEFVRGATNGREVELNLTITAAPTDETGHIDLSLMRRYALHSSDEELSRLPGVLSGTPRDMADQVRTLQERYGISYLTVMLRHAEQFAKVIAELRQ
ncbi:LLM class F420-dependent oxidoreductase [Mycolicibacterium murale]|uniref:LLM class F420-dependent oxidoreductase n=1 Tax=Mycolicibacterium murale TaxID=182220 RepID=A0A7I9WVX6_9MYCO|nr:TIGR03621 family F420-dependent LLM class oxidoreductase [Mycolicibacterium murale]MCV7184306.1 TIGR03621 family F420-dependent LLM class oxidoreductase [Mycolicibacterium murale]GFG61845.1 LLM class F420-dependent oxidoreductase [Mycolicibacterium murale]